MMSTCRHCIGFRLVDVPELGYSTQDKPYPRGELRVKTKLMIPGYFKHPKVCLPRSGLSSICAAALAFDL